MKFRDRFRMTTDFFIARLWMSLQWGFDIYMGTSTTGVKHTATDFFHGGGDNWPYEGCGWPTLHFALRALRPSAADVFVDLGSGKGKALLVAGRFPYGRVIGVELDAELTRSAQRNLAQAARKLRARTVACETANATNWPFPDNATTVYLFNPFFGDTFRQAITQVFNSYDRNPRTIHIVYQYPWEHNWLLSTGRVVAESVNPGTWPSKRRWWSAGNVIVTYHVTDRAGAADRSCPLSGSNVSGMAMTRWRTQNDQRFVVRGPSGAGSSEHDENVTVVKQGDVTEVTGA